MRKRLFGPVGAGLICLSLALGACNLLPKGVIATASAGPSDGPTASASAGTATPKPTPTADILTGSVIFGGGGATATPAPSASPTAVVSATPTPAPLPTAFELMASSITLDLASASIGVPPPQGATPKTPTTIQVTADVTLNNGSHTSNVNWSSSNSAVATVGTSGLVTAVAKGQAVITATSKQTQLSGNPATKSATIFVIDLGDVDLTVD